MRFAKLSIAIAVLAVSAPALAIPAYYSSATFSSAVSVSNEGTAAGVLGGAFAIWNPTQGVETSIGGVGSSQAGISADGRYVGGSAAGSDGKAEIARYDRISGAWTTFGGAGGFSGTTRSSGVGISSDGSTVLGFGYGTPTGAQTFTGVRPITANVGGVIDYSLIPNATSVNRINASSANGSVVTGRTRYITSGTSTADGAYYWQGGVANPMYISGTTMLGEPSAMSGDGLVIGGLGNNASTTTGLVPNIRKPYLFERPSNTVTLIDSIAGDNGNTIPGTVTRIDGFLTGLSSDGNTAVGFFRASAPSVFADKSWGFIWTRGVGVQSIDLWAANMGITDAATKYLIPAAISADGSVITGSQFTRSGPFLTTGFMITSIPEPSAISLLVGVGFLAIGRRSNSRA